MQSILCSPLGEPNYCEERRMVRWMIGGEHSWYEQKHCCRCTLWPGSWSQVMGTSVQMKLKVKKDNRKEKMREEKGGKERVNYPGSSERRGERNTNRPLCAKVAWYGVEISLFRDLCLWLEKCSGFITNTFEFSAWKKKSEWWKPSRH